MKKELHNSSDTGRESLRTIVTRLYGEETHNRIRHLGSLRNKRSQLLASLAFLSRCRDQDRIPKYLQVQHHIQSTAARRIYERTSKALLREQIHATRRNLDKVGRELYALHMDLAALLNPRLWQEVDGMTANVAEKTHLEATTRQKTKFERLTPTTPTRPQLDQRRVVINRSNTTLSSDAITVLAKGGNFAVTPKTIPVEEIINGVEAGIRQLGSMEAEEVRAETCRVLRRAQPPKSNLTRGEREALKQLKQNNDILILPADKGNATVVMDTVEYNQKIENLISNETYSVCKQDPTAKIERRTKALLKATPWDEKLVKELSPSDSKPPRLYGLPKIHKDNMPLRPIINAIGTPTYKVARYLATLMKRLVGNTEHHVKNSAHFVNLIDSMKTSPEDILVSFDVESLFTNVPVQDTLQLLDGHFPPEVIELFKQCLTSTYFQWNGQFYDQKDGVAMGSPLSPVMANFFMEHFEQEALRTAPKSPKCWLRYVDDTFIVWQHGRESLQEFLDHLNRQHAKIRFTMEVEQGGALPFLDILVKRDSSGKLGRAIYRKKTHTDRYLQESSNHHPSQKRAVIKTLVHRAVTLADDDHREEEMAHLRTVLQANGYSNKNITRAIKPRQRRTPGQVEERADEVTTMLPYIHNVTDRISKILRKKGIRTTFTPSVKISQLLRSPKDQLDPLHTPGVYLVPCKDCPKVYVGMTKRTVAARRKEHERHLRLHQPEKSAVAEHAWTEGHRIAFEDTKVLVRTNGYYNLARREALEIVQYPDNINRDDGLKISRAWMPLMTNKQVKQNEPTRMAEHAVNLSESGSIKARLRSQSSSSAANRTMRSTEDAIS